MKKLVAHLTLASVLLVSISNVNGAETIKSLDENSEWKYHISIKALERWVKHGRKKVNANLQLGAQQNNLKYELDLKYDHPDYSGFSAKRYHFHDTKQTQRHALVKVYYEFPIINDISVSPFIGAGLHSTTITKHKMVLKKKPNSSNGYIPEYTYRKKTKRGMAYEVGLELAYAFTNNVYSSLG